MWGCAVPCMLACMRRLSCKQTIIIPYKSDFPAGTLQLCKRITWTVMRCTDASVTFCMANSIAVAVAVSLHACVRTYVRVRVRVCNAMDRNARSIDRRGGGRSICMHANSASGHIYMHRLVRAGGAVWPRVHMHACRWSSLYDGGCTN